LALSRQRNSPHAIGSQRIGMSEARGAASA
jgi:hypothetical protein